MKTTTFFRIMRYIQTKPAYYLGLSARALFGFAQNLMFATFLLNMFNAAAEGDLSTLFAHLRLTLLIAGGLLIFYPISNYIYEYGVAQTTAHLRKQTFGHIQRLPASYGHEHHSGDLVSRVTNDLQALEGVYSQNLLSIVSSIISGIAALAVMFILNWQLALIIVIFGLTFSVVNLQFVKSLKKTSEQVQISLGKLTERLSDVLASLPVTKTFGLEAMLNNKYQQENTEVLALSQKRVMQNSLLNGINYITGFMGFGGLLLVGGFFVLSGRATFGEIVFMVQMQNSVNQLFTNLGNQLTALQTALAGSRRVLELMDTPQEPWLYELESIKPGTKKHAEDIAIELQNVSFQYTPEKPVISGIDLSVPRGKMYALVGLSGGGKSTLFKLMLGFYPPHTGDIVIDGHSMSTTSLEKIRDKIAYVPQDTYLFAGTIGENIAYGKSHVSKSEIIAAARAAFAHDFISALPDGYDTVVGERGTRLSGGQRQRIAIARAILKDAPILLLDEATSALDTESEELVQQALEKLMYNRTTLVVAHRLATIQQADQILVIDKGQVGESGSHQELLADPNSIYTRLYNLQFEKSA